MQKVFHKRSSRKRLKKIAFLFWLLIPILGNSQNIPTGTWRTHYSFNNTISISQSDKNIFAASLSGLYIVNKNDQSISSITTLNGLSETGITQINFNSTTNTLLITYTNGQIDLLKDNFISSIPDIKLSDIIDSKITYHMNNHGEDTYLSTDFGVVQIDTKTKLITNSYLKLSSSGTNLKVYASTIYNDSLFLATENGVIVGSLSENLKDYSKWKRFDIGSGINQITTKVISLYKGKPITGNNAQGVLIYENGKWIPTNELIGSEFSCMNPAGLETIITTTNGVFLLKDNFLTKIASEFITSPTASLIDGQLTWVSDIQNGLIKIKGTSSESLYPNGPFFNNITKIVAINESVFAIPSFINNAQPARTNKGFSVFENGQWTNYNSTGFPKTKSIPEFLDISDVCSYKNNNIIFSSYGYGLLTWESDLFSIINESNSPLVNSNSPNRNVLISDIATDNQAIWILNNKVSSSLQSLSNNNIWSSFSPSSSVSEATQITSTPWGDQWITIPSGGIVIYNKSQDQITLENSGSGTIPSNTVNQIVLDREDKMWIATNSGVAYYNFPYSIFDDPNQKAIIPIIDYRMLFYKEKVNTIAIDGGNRIWIGTNKGAWLFDKDGSVLVDHFNTDNSPLLSNVVTNITINHVSGEVFFNTSKGLISYRGSATITKTFNKPKIFPNPVTPEFIGVITIEGVPNNSLLKITDSSGRLVANLEANGNSAVWDLKNEYTSQIGTGIYFVFISSTDGTEKQIGKIAILK